MFRGGPTLSQETPERQELFTRPQLAAVVILVVLLAAGLFLTRHRPWAGEVTVTRGDASAYRLLLDPNTASADELALLPSLGPVKAAAIVEYREAHGPFASLTDLENVPGIGEKTAAAIGPHITFAGGRSP